VCALLPAWTDGDTSALERLTPIVYDELHRLARRYMRGERPGHGGLNVDETADVLKVSAATVMRDWNTAKTWLYRELAGGTRDGR
jgi:hypothetical protein